MSCEDSQKKVSSNQRHPLLVLFNRKRDVQGMLYHSWKYLALIQDIFGIRNNQFFYTDDQGKNEAFELDFGPN